MADKDYYKILGVPENASLDEIKKAFRQLAMRYHPDRNQDNRKAAEERFKTVSEAYYVLSDEKRRQEYDMFRKGYSGYSGGQYTGTQGFDFEEILKHFGQGQGRGRTYRTTSRGPSGTMFEDIFDIFNHMGQGGGSGAEEYMSDNDDGFGSRQTFRGHTDVQATLSVPSHVAKSGGEILFKHNGKKITLKIKPGTRPGQKLRIREQGSICSSCGHPGDLIITVR
ncbi:MAG: DnaJ domain-containing protein [Candidatus Omnitrophica bacterium]|nr:DnaJ domain-containing protein [Candidatus Omnitrophota bacterium]